MIRQPVCKRAAGRGACYTLNKSSRSQRTCNLTYDGYKEDAWGVLFDYGARNHVLRYL